MRGWYCGTKLTVTIMRRTSLNVRDVHILGFALFTGEDLAVEFSCQPVPPSFSRLRNCGTDKAWCGPVGKRRTWFRKRYPSTSILD